MTDDPMDQQIEALKSQAHERALRVRKFLYQPELTPWTGGGRSARIDDLNALEKRVIELTEAAHDLCKSSGPLSMHEGIEFVSSEANSKMMDVLYGEEDEEE